MTGPDAGVDVEFRADGLRGGSGMAGDTAAAAVPLIDRLAGLTINAALFGRVALAEPLASALSAARDGFRDLGEQVRDAHTGLAARARSAARHGDRMVDETARTAQHGRAGR